jgi:succinyl-CoA synthetase alpha subunit
VSILVSSASRVLVQGISGSAAARQTRIMREYGTPLVGGVAPGRGGQEVEGLPVFDTVRSAVRATGADVSLIMVPPRFAGEAILEAAWAGVPLIVCVTEGVPIWDMLRVREWVATAGSRLIGPNCPGLMTPGQARVGIMPPDAFAPGPVGLISRSGTLGYETARQLTRAGLGQSTVCGIGGDPIKGSSMRDLLPLFAADPATRALVLCGEIGGTDEEEAAELIAAGGLGDKPAVAFIAGRHAPPERRMGHAGAIIADGVGTWQAKTAALRAAGVVVAESPLEIPRLIGDQL